MYSVSKLAKLCGLSRTTILYYEKEGLLTPAMRSENGYRWYSDKELDKLKAINSYRSFGMPVSQIRELLDKSDELKQEQVLLNQFNALEKEIQKLRSQQQAIVTLLEQPQLLTGQELSKERWVTIMQGAGFDEKDMQNWHKEFEKLEPDAHQEFLESLNIDEQEIKQIREWSRS
ncbi:transcriptional regulator [Vibrio ishigakensis]|uniref:Transcriptional regulator n=1 Tax=Vibrio ishigakensis TaxID=1481914 RepID=A0A0B8QDM3_9VIBR|nr:transcriptional regulator [Vibrio ishigakensis]